MLRVFRQRLPCLIFLSAPCSRMRDLMRNECFMSFERLASDSRARRGRLIFPRGTVETPAFMPVGTYGTVKGMTPESIESIGAEIILGNTFHLWLRPGVEVIEAHGDLHRF